MLRAGLSLLLMLIKAFIFAWAMGCRGKLYDTLYIEELDSEYAHDSQAKYGHLSQSIATKNASLRKYDGLAAASEALLLIGFFLSLVEEAPYYGFFSIIHNNELLEFGPRRTNCLALACGLTTALKMATVMAAHVTVWQLAEAIKWCEAIAPFLQDLEDSHVKDNSRPELDFDLMGIIRSISGSFTAILVLSAIRSALNLLFLLFAKVLPTRWRLPADVAESMPLANSQTVQNDGEDYENTGTLAEAYKELYRESTASRDPRPVATTTNWELVVSQQSLPLPPSQ
jgi:hypothetical protein